MNTAEMHRRMFGGSSVPAFPGSGIRSRGMGRGRAAGWGRGPVGRPVGLGPAPGENVCLTPGARIRSGGRGRGLARGGGRGPMGIPYGYKYE